MASFRYPSWYTRWQFPEWTWCQPPVIHLEITTHCNLACLMCPRTYLVKHPDIHNSDRWNQFLSMHNYRKILDVFCGARSIRLHGLGEPLTHPDLVDMVNLAHTRHKKVDFTTNAILLTPALGSELIKAGLSHITVSLDGATQATYQQMRPGASLELVLENVRSLMHQKRVQRKRFPSIAVNTVVTKDNLAELPHIAQLAKKIGAEELRASPIEPITQELSRLLPDRIQWSETARNMHRYAKEIGIKFEDHGASKAVQKKEPAELSQRKHCSRPWLAPFIRVDGYLTPCCNISDRDILGRRNVLEEEFIVFWNSDSVRRFRAQINQGHYPPTCLQCPLSR